MTEPTQPKADKSSDSAEKAEKAEKALRKLEAERGPLDASGRNKALANGVKAAQHLIDLGDKKARFALVVMSALNAVTVLLVVRGGEGALPRTGIFAMLIRVEVAVYAMVTVFYITQAIAALRPRGVRPPPLSELPSVVEPGVSMRVLFYADVIARDRAQYQALWSELRTDNLNTELADQLYTLSVINRQKFAALDRLYVGLTVMTAMLTALVATIGLNRFVG